MYTSIVSMLQNLHLIKFVKDNIFYLFKKKKKICLFLSKTLSLS